MDWDRSRRFDDHRGGESYRPGGSRAYLRRSRSPPRVRSPRLVADTWVPSHSRTYARVRSRSPPAPRRRLSRSPSFYNREMGIGAYVKTCSPPRRFSPRRSEVRNRSPHQASWRSRSPYGEGRQRDISWSRNNPKRPRDPSPRSQEFRFPRRERPQPPADIYMKPDIPLRDSGSRAPLPRRSRSPFYGGRRERNPEIPPTPKRRSPSPKGTSPMRTSASGSLPDSRRSSPFLERPHVFPSNAPSRSPTYHNPHRSARAIKDKPTIDDPRHRSPVPDRPTGKGQDIDIVGSQRRLSEIQETDPSPPNTAYPRNVPVQPKAYGNIIQGQAPPSGPSHGPKIMSLQNRGSNISLLSAPTRPRGGLGFKEPSWAGSPVRRGLASTGLHAPPPTGPRSSLMPTGPGVDLPRSNLNRQGSLPGTSYPPRIPRLASHLVGLRQIVPEGKALPSSLDIAIEKRLSQLDADKDKLLDQIADSQKLRRLGNRDWDTLDRESSICALKSELAEGHLQRIADGESVHVGAMF
ncbi:hypothetical protein BO94DRAFT_535482 [Aspergillus sclerotioniger CBS 115572]|uniref:Serine/arginine repetitive matrix protein 1 n=1 Tax=Aspergillus sclerotioniger CBS 115572 TaxID=1450535 RepID=A0A317WMQ9_9EURO|nr:hypothetical protein BO94DRAFT_535482 [Aspergillus sclerotioniger CBS 115572]PWY86318.1 hypothetical protein BO94DRAFT_535482 [Aspergillus sclerotioniger CBS 115572]